MSDSDAERETALAVRPQVMSLEEAQAWREHINTFMRENVLIKERHYGHVIDKSGNKVFDKPILLKPGAEMIKVFFGMAHRFETVSAIERTTPGDVFFMYVRKCVLFDPRTGVVLGEGIGSANSREKQFRREGRLECPDCGAKAMHPSKYPVRDDDGVEHASYYCNPNYGGCKANIRADAPFILDQLAQGTGFSDEAAYDNQNTIGKIADKRALVAGVLITCGASEFFGQDLDDYTPTGVVEGEFVTGDDPRAEKAAEGDFSSPGNDEPESQVPPSDEGDIKYVACPGVDELRGLYDKPPGKFDDVVARLLSWVLPDGTRAFEDRDGLITAVHVRAGKSDGTVAEYWKAGLALVADKVKATNDVQKFTNGRSARPRPAARTRQMFNTKVANWRGKKSDGITEPQQKMLSAVFSEAFDAKVVGNEVADRHRHSFLAYVTGGRVESLTKLKKSEASALIELLTDEPGEDDSFRPVSEHAAVEGMNVVNARLKELG